MDDFFASLEADIAKEISKTRKVSDLEKARKAANNMRATTSDRAKAKAEWYAISKELEAQQWADDSIFAMFTEQHCDGCGSTHRTFLQYMLKQVMIRQPTTQRFVAITKPIATLPRDTMVQVHTTHICADCALEHNFDVNSPTRRVVNLYGAVSVSKNYEQGEPDDYSEYSSEETILHPDEEEQSDAND